MRKQTIKAVKEAVQAAPAAVVRHSQRTRVANRRYDSPFDDVISDSVNANKKPPPPPVIAKGRNQLDLYRYLALVKKMISAL